MKESIETLEPGGEATGVSAPTPAQLSRSAFLELTKPRLAALSTLTSLAGYGLAPGAFSASTFAAVFVGSFLSAGGALALNQFAERDTDRLMRRTRNRPLPTERIRPVHALVFGLALSFAGCAILALGATPLAAGLSVLTIASYVLLYTPLKYRSPLCTHIGAFPGALPPLIGWTGSGAPLDLSAAVLFLLLLCWQIPHFFAIAAFCGDDYRAAGIRVLQVGTGRIDRLRVETVGFAAAALVLSLLPPFFLGSAGITYALVAAVAGGTQLVLAIRFARDPAVPRARSLFFATLLYLPIVLVSWILDRGLRG